MGNPSETLHTIEPTTYETLMPRISRFRVFDIFHISDLQLPRAWHDMPLVWDFHF